MQRVVTIASVLVMTGSAAHAQVVERPVRSVTSAGRSMQELTVEGSLLGGYDDNMVPPTGGDMFATYPSGYTGYGESTLRYRVGNQLRFFEAKGGGFMNTYRNVGLGPSYGGLQQVRARAGLGRRTEIDVSQRLRYMPRFSLGLFGPVQPELGGDTNTTNALNESESWIGGVSGTIIHSWTRRSSLDAAYSFDKQTYVDDLQDSTFDSRNHVATVGYSHLLGRWAGIRTTYQHGDNEYLNFGGVIPIVTQTADVGFTYRRRLSLSRQLSIAGSGGASHVETADIVTHAPIKYWQPVASAVVRMDIGRSWSLGGDYRRSTAVLQGTTPEPFNAHTAQVNVGGDLNRWLEGVFTVAYANGLSGTQAPGMDAGEYSGYSGTAQLGVKLTPSWSSVVSYTHFNYRLNDQASETLGVSQQLQRNAVRVGMSWSLPVYRAN